MTIASNPRWRDPVPVSIDKYRFNTTVARVPKPTGPKCRGCKSEPINDAYAPYCGEWCQRSVEACGK